MPGTLPRGYTIRTLLNETVIIDDYLAEGGQGEVYKVIYKGEPKALKWYKNGRLGNIPEAFHKNLENNVYSESPSSEFLWPIDLTTWDNDSFGYVMDLKPDGYFDITDFMLTNVRFPSFKTIIDAALKIISAFRILHNRGYSYQDLNDGNFFINPNNGDVLICDNDNISPDGFNTGILGKPRYMAPEIVLGNSQPNSLTDRYSLSVIIYILFCLNHPLEGKRYLVSALTPELHQQLYGEDPVFIMDPYDNRNEPHPVIHRNSIIIWQALPQYIKDIFIQAFSKEALNDPSLRPKEIDWLKTLTRFRNEIVRCTCGSEIFMENGETTVCDNCGVTIRVPYKLELSNYDIPALPGNRIYRSQIGFCRDEEALNPVAMVIANKNNLDMLGLLNKSQEEWIATTPSGNQRKVGPGEVVPLKDGIKLEIFGEEIKIKENKE